MQVSICPLCKHHDSQFRFSERGYKLLACQVCNLLFIDPYPFNLDTVHEKVSAYNYDEIEIQSPDKHYRFSVQFYKHNFPRIDEECRDATSVLDVGCGTGHLLELLGRYLNLYRAGIELNAGRAEMARRISKCDIHEVPIENFSSTRKFDVIIMINVLSHVPSFDHLFSSIRSLLSDHGRLILKVGECTKNVKKTAIYDWGTPDHLHFLGIGTLDFICEKYRFKVLRHERIPLSQQLFSKSRWRSPGRSLVRNAIKNVVALTPLALPVLAKAYDMIHGRTIYSSFVVLTPQD
jgi:SAM-dependent methyltransferase